MGISTAIQEGIQRVKNRNIEKGKIDTKANKTKQHISTLWKNSLNSRKQAFFQCHKAKNIAEIFTELLKEILRKCLGNFYQKLYQTKTKKKQL